MVERQDPPPLPTWLAEQLPFDRYRVELSDGTRMHVMEGGEGRPVILFHGNPTWGYLYRKVARELEDEPFRVIMPDLVGLGYSDRVPSARMTLKNHTSWTAELVAGLDLEDAVVVVQDWGGAIGLHAMSQNPHVMTGLVVLNTVIGPPRVGFKPTTFHRLFSSPLGPLLSRYLGLPQRRLSFAQGDKQSIGKAEQLAYNHVLAGPDGYKPVIDFVRMVPDTMDHPSVPLLREVAEFIDSYEGGAAIVWGEKDPVLGRVRRRIERQLPRAEVIITQAGHFVVEEVPELIADAIRGV